MLTNLKVVGIKTSGVLIRRNVTAPQSGVIMFLATMDIQKLVTTHMISFLCEADLTYGTIKQYLIDKAPISSVHFKLAQFISQEKTKNLREVRQRLEDQAFNNQIQEDEKEKELEQIQQRDIKQEQTRLKKDLNGIPKQIATHQKVCLLMQSELNQLNAMQHYTKQPIKQSDQTMTRIVLLKKKLFEHEVKILNLTQHQTIIESKLHELTVQSNRIKRHQSERKFRAQARVGYSTSTEGIHNTLSVKNSEQLIKNIETQTSSLESKASHLISEAETINYGTYIEQLQLNSSKIHLKSAEIDALAPLLKYVKLYLDAESQANMIESTLNTKRNSISNQWKKLNQLKAKLSELKNSKLSTQNSQLLQTGDELKPKYEKLTQLNQRLKYATYIAFFVTLSSTVPLILTWVGIIPLVTSAAVLYSLVSIPPSLSLLTTIALAISTLVYYFKAQQTDTLIKTQEQTLENNVNQMRRNENEIKTMLKFSIPTAERQIEKDEQLRDTLDLQLKECKSKAQTYLDKVKSVEPVSGITTSIFETNTTAEKNVAKKPTEDGEDEVSELEEETSPSLSIH